MSQHAQAGSHAMGGGGRSGATAETGWVGWVWFAAVMLIVLGAFNTVSGLVALFRRSFYVVADDDVLVFPLTTWGWIHLVIGVLAIIVGATLFSGAMWARVAAVVLVAINALTQLAFLVAYPIWATLIIALDVVVIWAIVVHGGELTASRRKAKT
jgi:E3 ubiquitin-protein ligase DOA10